MSRFFVQPEMINGRVISVTGEEAHHIVDVMRLSVGDKIVVFDGTGTEYFATIRELNPRSVTADVNETRKPSSGNVIKTKLIQAVPKKDRMEYILEKSTELGVSEIVPVITDRTIPQWDRKKIDSHLRRWSLIVKEASKQCGRTDLPMVSAVQDFKTAISGSGDYCIKLIAALTADAKPLKAVLNGADPKSIAIAIGPEGDFAPEEIEYAKHCGFDVVNLGPRVLKSDTAGLAVLSMVGYEFSQ
ncbi:MAG: 16S rRNA (uracil(1498)-N(3))-methyltransferase [Candidatus Omnitrophica bacterium]|nr:16S rRNA (uracil(1498)-N(3))-methyltransferase [Candidatus Omnitrophota bacterium]